VNPHFLDPNPNIKVRPVEADQFLPSKDEDFNTWTAPFLMALSNTRVVRRSAALLLEDSKLADSSSPSGIYQNLIAEDFTYQESFKVRGVISAFVTTIALFFLLFTFFTHSQIIGMLTCCACARNLLLRLVAFPAGKGPSETRRSKNRCKFTFLGRGDVEGPDGKTRTVELRASLQGGDPFYTETSKMVSEAALCLALNHREGHVPALVHSRGGVLTPATACGLPLLDHLTQAGLNFTILSKPIRA